MLYPHRRPSLKRKEILMKAFKTILALSLLTALNFSFLHATEIQPSNKKTFTPSQETIFRILKNREKHPRATLLRKLLLRNAFRKLSTREMTQENEKSTQSIKELGF